jgi:hypothetical protein
MSEKVLMVMVPPSFGPSEGLLDGDADGDAEGDALADVLGETEGESDSDDLLLVHPVINTAASAKTVNLEPHLFFLTNSSSS